MKRFVSALLIPFLLIAALPGCSRKSGDGFSFRIRWGVMMGQSSFDSGTGVLIKTTNASDPDKFKTKLKLSRKDLAELSELAAALDLSAIPDAPETYEPYITKGGGWALAKPANILELTLRTEEGEKTILCKGSLGLMLWDEDMRELYEPAGANGAAFVTLVRRILGMIHSSKEWKALPEYEVLYQ